jgi:exopolysaccharide biosynthesis protein
MKKLILILSVLFLCVSFVNYNSFKNVFSNDSQINEKVKITKIDLSDKFKINGVVNMIKLTKNSLSYKVTNKNHRNYDFYINANYFTIDNIPVGEVKINGKVVKHKNKNGGFFTSNGKSPSFYFTERPNNVLYSSQTHTPIIMNGKPNYKIFNKKWAKYKLPRLLIGENKNKDIIVLHTINNTKCSVKDFYNIAKSQGLVNALMFDGGASIEVGVSNQNVNYNYQIVSDIERKIGNVPTPSVFIVGNFN